MSWRPWLFCYWRVGHTAYTAAIACERDPRLVAVPCKYGPHLHLRIR